ncbi:hypothetical protein DFH06DRAFT_1167319 [Mycena polygramma]|nr:hypothetical protein DFH06DRAFT_1167319 [Mycena polygramma]
MPGLAELTLSGTFASYASFVRSMSNFPGLKSLTIGDVQWNGIADPRIPLSGLCLDTLCLQWEPRIEHFVSSLRSRRLCLRLRATLRPPQFAQRVRVGAAFVKFSSQYLRSWGDHLRHLRLVCDLVEQIPFVSSLDFRRSTGLRHLSIDEAVCYYLLGRFEITVSPDLRSLLIKMAAHCPLESLTLGPKTTTMRLGFPNSQNSLPGSNSRVYIPSSSLSLLGIATSSRRRYLP